MYPIKFENIYFEKIWGGRDLRTFRNNLALGEIGESWDVSCHEKAINVVANGEFKGTRFDELINKYRTEILGGSIKSEFPLLIKLINSNEKLSLQVHPNDEYAKRVENSNGKTEAWYVIDAKEGAELIIGTKNCDKETFIKSIKEEKTENYINKIKVKKGDCFLINSGLVHAICKGVILAEIQQSSDITYRIYDYNRGRKLDVEKSLDVIDFSLTAKNLGEKNTDVFDGFEKVVLCENKYFTIEKYLISSSVSEQSDINKFFVLICVEGIGYITDSNGSIVSIKKGDSILIPATLGDYTITGCLTVLKVFV